MALRRPITITAETIAAVHDIRLTRKQVEHYADVYGKNADAFEEANLGAGQRKQVCEFIIARARRRSRRSSR